MLARQLKASILRDPIINKIFENMKIMEDKLLRISMFFKLRAQHIEEP